MFVINLSSVLKFFVTGCRPKQGFSNHYYKEFIIKRKNGISIMYFRNMCSAFVVCLHSTLNRKKFYISFSATFINSSSLGSDKFLPAFFTAFSAIALLMPKAISAFTASYSTLVTIPVCTSASDAVF